MKNSEEKMHADIGALRVKVMSWLISHPLWREKLRKNNFQIAL